jgi:membrane-associated phospholipid phosphatase
MALFVVIISMSRIILKAHTIAQVTIGSIAGFILTYIQLHYIFFI